MPDMIPDPSPGPPPPAPVPSLWDAVKALAASLWLLAQATSNTAAVRWAWAGVKGAHYVVRNYAGTLALALVLTGYQGCTLPVIPWPTPTPVPPPKPPEPPAPIPVSGFRVLVLLESADRPPTYIHSKAILDYLDLRCIKEGKFPAHRVFDKDQSMANVSKLWQDAFALAKSESKGVLPWIIISNGDRGYSGPLPKDEASLLSKLQEYGGV